MTTSTETKTKRIVLVGHCGPDGSYLRMAITGALGSARIAEADDEQSLKRALDEGVDLILFNRQLDWGFDTTNGVELIRRLRQTHPRVKTMLVSNYADAQAVATNAGALPGFGKREIGSKRVTELLRSAFAE
jgi:DNA-binding NarL/FixJ family response regulator